MAPRRSRLAALGLAALTLPLAFGAVVRADDDLPWRQGYVMKGDRKIEGKIQDRGDRIIIREGNGIELEFASGEVSRPVYTESEDTDTGASGNKRRLYEVKKLDGTIIRGYGEERDGSVLVIRPQTKDGKELPEVTIRLAETEYANPIEESGADQDQDHVVDPEGRFVLERPSPDWKIRRPSSPTIRAQMVQRDGDKSITLSVSARPAPSNPAFLEVTRDNARKIQSDIQAELQKELDRVGSVQADLGELFGTPVYEVRYEGSFFGETTNYQFLEVRFVRDGIMYAVTGSGDSKYFKDYLSKVRDAFNGFSFLAAVSADDESYTDLVQGFALDRPSPRWRLEARPFDSDKPATFYNEDGRARVRVELCEANGRTASAFVDGVLKDAGSKAGFEKGARSQTTRAGVAVESYRCEYFDDNSTQKRDLQGLVAVLGHRILHVIGEAPITDPDSKQLQQEAQSSLDRLRLLDPDLTKQRLANGPNTVALLAQGIDAQKRRAWQDAATSYTKAIESYSDYARAFFLRAMVDEELKQWKACREDLAKATQLDPRPEVANRAAGVFLKEAQDRAKDKQWVEASKAWKEVLRADSKNQGFRHDIVRFYQDWWNDLKKCPPSKIKESVEEIERNRWSDKEFNKTMADMLAEAGEVVLRDNKRNWDRARGLASRALSYDRTSSRAKNLQKEADSARQSLEGGKRR